MCLESQYHAGTNIWLILYTDTVRVARNLLALCLPPRERREAAQVTLVGGDFSVGPVQSHGKVSLPES